MKQRARIYYTQTQKALMWERWKKGESLQQIAQWFDRNHSSVHRILAVTGGIRPPEHCRSRLALTFAEREEISRAVVVDRNEKPWQSQLLPKFRRIRYGFGEYSPSGSCWAVATENKEMNF